MVTQEYNYATEMEKVENDAAAGGFVLINKSEFDEKKHKRFSEKKPLDKPAGDKPIGDKLPPDKPV